jgi:hypothetical protein
MRTQSRLKRNEQSQILKIAEWEKGKAPQPKMTGDILPTQNSKNIIPKRNAMNNVKTFKDLKKKWKGESEKPPGTGKSDGNGLMQLTKERTKELTIEPRQKTRQKTFPRKRVIDRTCEKTIQDRFSLEYSKSLYPIIVPTKTKQKIKQKSTITTTSLNTRDIEKGKVKYKEKHRIKSQFALKSNFNHKTTNSDQNKTKTTTNTINKMIMNPITVLLNKNIIIDKTHRSGGGASIDLTLNPKTIRKSHKKTYKIGNILGKPKKSKKGVGCIKLDC